MGQDNNLPDNDAKEAFQAYQAFKAYKAQSLQQGNKPPNNPADAMEQKQGGPEESRLKSLLKTGLGAWQAARGGLLKGATLGNLDPAQISGPNPFKEAMSEHPIASGAGQLGGALASGGLVGAGLGAVLPTATGILPSAARVSGNIGGAGLQGYLRKPQDDETRLENATNTMKSPWTWGPAIGAEAIANSGNILKNLANRAELRAVGLTGAKSKNLPPDTGVRLIQEGVWGGRPGMAEHVAEKYREIEDTIQGKAAELEGGISSDELASSIREKASRFLNPETGRPTPGYEQAHSTFDEIASGVERGGQGYTPAATGASQEVETGFVNSGGRPILRIMPGPATEAKPGTYGASALLRLKRAGDEQAFNQSGLLGNTYAAEAYKAQGDAGRSALAKLSELEGAKVTPSRLPETPSDIPSLLAKERDLINANKGLRQPEMVSKNPVSLTDIGASLVGASARGLPGAGTAALASKAALLPITQSLFAKGALQGSEWAEALADPQVQQALFGMKLSQ